MGHSAPLLEGSEISVHRRPVSMTSFQLASSIQMLRVICTGVRDLLVLQTLLLVLRTGAFSLRRSASPNGSLHPPPLFYHFGHKRFHFTSFGALRSFRFTRESSR